MSSLLAAAEQVVMAFGLEDMSSPMSELEARVPGILKQRNDSQ